MENKYRVPIYSIDSDGDLKHLFFLETDILPQIGETICYILCDEQGKPNYREYYDVVSILRPVIDSDGEHVVHGVGERVYHVKLTVSEPII